MEEDNFNSASNDVRPSPATNIAEIGTLVDRPLMMLFNRLIDNENKQNTVMTNSQITAILEQEFDINTKELHELEMDIYISVMKKFLKDWPQWDDFDSALNRFKDNYIPESKFQKVLITKYHQLKNYLSIMLDIARPRAKDKVKEVEEKFPQEVVQKEKEEEEEEDTSDVILEISCTRQQLNSLIYRKPHPEQNYTIFNSADSEPTKITIDVTDYNAILNWWNINIVFKVENLHFIRSTAHEVTHTLVNNKLNKKNKFSKLKKGYQAKSTLHVKNNEMKGPTRNELIKVLREIYENCETGYIPILEVLYSVFEKDLTGLPTELQDMVMYKKFFSKYPYVRYLCTDVPEANAAESEKYDLQLRELLNPMYQFNIIKCEPVLKRPIDMKSIHLECKTCTLKFIGVTMLEQLKQHILENHYNEPEWQCMKCKTNFCMVKLASKRWMHKCSS